MTLQTDLLKQFLLDNIKYILPDGASGARIKNPEFELYARDYLRFAENELEKKDERRLINCISHLKRAMDCNIDNFFHVFGLFNIFHKRNLKFDRKMEFLKEAGVFSGRTLSRLNAIRNRMEHSYEIPKIREIETYFDLVTAFVAVLERTISFGGQNQRDFVIVKNDASYTDHISGVNPSKYYLITSYKFDGPQIGIVWETENEQQNLVADTSDIYEFAYFFRVFILMAQHYTLAGEKYIISQL